MTIHIAPWLLNDGLIFAAGCFVGAVIGAALLLHLAFQR